MATQIRVLLQQDVENLGHSGDVVRVRPGHARNYLIPRGLALPATPGNLARVDELKRAAAVRAKKDQEEAVELKQKLEATSVKVVRAVGEENKMYGSVTAKDIEEAYAEHGIKIDRRKLHLAEPIKQLGLAEVVMKLHHDVTATLRVEVIKQT
jgi:large subunit ribosomal protein L9